MSDGVIFLDVDGVLNRMTLRERWATLATLPQPGQELPLVTDWNIVQALCQTLEKTTIKIVVSSTWRKIADDADHFSRLTGVFRSLIHDDWSTGHHGDRGDQVVEWLYRHKEVTTHCVIDDSDYNFKDYADKITLVKTDDRVGMSFDNLTDVLKPFKLRPNRNYTVSTLGGPTAFILNTPT